MDDDRAAEAGGRVAEAAQDTAADRDLRGADEGGDPRLAVLWEQAALTSGWPTLHVHGADEAAVEAAWEALEAELGPLPQADVIEPWGEDDEDPRWELRVDLPDLDAPRWEVAREAVRGAQLRPGVREGVRLADDLGIRLEERLEAGEVEAVLHLGAEGSLSLDLARAAGGDDAIAELETELAHAVREVDRSVCFRSDRGPDTVATVVHRSTGRFGVQLTFGAEVFEALDGDAVLERRRALLQAVGGVLASRAAHPRVRLAPDLRWDVPLGGLVLTAWIIAPPVPGLPADAPIGEGRWPREEALAALVGDPSQVEDIELQVVPAAGRHREVAEVVAQRLQGASGEIRGALPRWVRYRGGWVFCPVWKLAAPDAGVLPELLEMAWTEGVVAVRVVPGEPAGLGEAWSTAVPAWSWGAARCLVRVRDGVTDRDRLPEAGARPRSPRDAEVELALFAALVGTEGARGLLPGSPGPATAVVDGAGREGLELGFDRSSFQEGALRGVLAAIGAVPHPELAPVAWYAHRQDRTVVRLWFRSESSDGPTWR